MGGTMKNKIANIIWFKSNLGFPLPVEEVDKIRNKIAIIITNEVNKELTTYYEKLIKC